MKSVSLEPEGEGSLQA